MIKIQIASQAGFCMGVRRAVSLTLEESRKHRGRLFTHGALIHNPQILKLLERRNIKPINNLDEIGPDGKIIIRAHGVSPGVIEEMRARGLPVLDATCPHVARIHKIIREQIQEGRDIVIVGDKGHTEVAGLEGSARGRAHVIGSVEEFKKLPLLAGPAVVAQTTQSVARFAELVEVIGRQYPQAAIFNTICRATGDRQAEIMALSKNADLTIVVGGKASANTRRLVDVVAAQGKESVAVEDEGDLLPAMIQGKSSILVAAGASTPNWMIHRVVQHIRRLEYESWSKLVRWLIRSADMLAGAYVQLGAVAVLFAAAVWNMAGYPRMVNALYLFVIFSYMVAMYTLNHLTNIEANQLQEIFKRDPINRFRTLYIAVATVSSVAALVAALLQGIYPGLFVALLEIAGLVYNTDIVPGRFAGRFRYHRIKDIPLSKDLGISFAWMSVIVLFPLITAPAGRPSPAGVVFISLLVAGIAFLRAIASDLQDVQKDMFLGRETIPTHLGAKKVWWVSNGINTLIMASLAFGFLTSAFSAVSGLMFCLPLLMGCVLTLHYLEKLPRLANLGLAMDGIIGLVSALVWLAA